jgi:hypothetical protein
MQGRLSRSGPSSEWADPKAFPGTVNGGVTYYYTEYSFSIPTNGNYFQIEIYDPFIAIFASAYLDTFTPGPGPTATNYLGDAGSSGGFDGFESFQVYVPSSHTLDLVINTVGAASLGRTFSITVESFSDRDYTDPVPEPASMALSLGGLAVFLLARRRRAIRQ